MINSVHLKLDALTEVVSNTDYETSTATLKFTTLLPETVRQHMSRPDGERHGGRVTHDNQEPSQADDDAWHDDEHVGVDQDNYERIRCNSTRPKELWFCLDCGLLSDISLNHLRHWRLDSSNDLNKAMATAH